MYGFSQNFGALKVDDRIIATAIVYMRRYFRLHSMKDSRPEKMMDTALLLASKVEENPIDIKLIHHSVKIPVLDLEADLIKALGCYLHVTHPHDELKRYIDDIRFDSQESKDKFFTATGRYLKYVYLSDVPLEYRPSEIAMAVIYFTGIMTEMEAVTKNWFKTLCVDMSMIGAISAKMAQAIQETSIFQSGEKIGSLMLSLQSK